ncbi:N-acetylmuramoyl-L-alanine amidase [Streptomyces piniterrae]|uniref:N-acetylmuramoyl-L-alanine amidase n=1 Tax=Streptomyces piniterrae TaxID=2571125 RepID=A0A4V5MLV9_9ACTN|nr:N-acetylmuramoyl-L-alanine amidase [Streptomyces piniterrae]TJZ58698.1 N-acetylmuramoyl-L-alanine amidase [Streptomyces piniterrae]
MEHDRPLPARRRLLTGAAALAVAAALTPLTATAAHATPLPDDPSGDTPGRDCPPDGTPSDSTTPDGTAPDEATPDGVLEGGAGGYPPCHWVPADPANYTAADRPTQYPVDLVVVHVTQETYDDTIRLFQDPNHKAAAHYLVRSEDGYIAQCVRERDVGWHAGNWDFNTRSIGIEHEGWIDKPEYFTDALYEQSALLTAAVCDRYGIPKDREHIIGHVEVPGTDHKDPGDYWDWARYIDLVNAATSSWHSVT